MHSSKVGKLTIKANKKMSDSQISETIKQQMIDAGKNKENKIEKKTSDEDHIYYNVVLTNTSFTNVLIAKYNQSRTTAIINNPSDYYCAIQRFTVPLQQVPIFVFLNNAYSVTISYNGNDYQTFLVYIPNSTLNLNSNEQFVYSYNNFIDSINNGLITSFNNFIAGLPVFNIGTTYAKGDIITYIGLPYISLQNGNIGNTPNIATLFWSQLTAPYMAYDAFTKLISIYAPSGWHTRGLTDAQQPLKLWFNTLLWDFFTNFNKIFNGYTPTAFNTNGKNYNPVIYPTGNNDITTSINFGGPLAGYRMTQEFVSLYNWNALRNIVFLTNKIPVRNEGIPANIYVPWNISQTYTLGSIVTYNNLTYRSIQLVNVGHQPDISPSFWIANQNSNVSSASQPILTDFQISVTDGPEARSYAQFFPQGEYRLIDLMGTDDLRDIQIDVYWQDKFLNLYPIFINPLDTLDIKLLFRKKSSKGSLTYN